MHRVITQRWRSAELIVLGLERPEVCAICFCLTLNSVMRVGSGFPVSRFLLPRYISVPSALNIAFI